MGRIISLCGRLRSGKGTMADICEKYGYERLYFALPLKNLCCDLLGVKLSVLNELKNNGEKINFKVTDSVIDTISEQTSIPVENIKNVIEGMTIDTVRDMLQIIGTDVIRAYNENWHIERIKNMINPDLNYVFEDTRFPNEKEFIESIGGDNWFIVRPDITNVSHHISEESLKWQYFGDNVIINNRTLGYLKITWEMFLAEYDKSKKARERAIVDIYLNKIDSDDMTGPFTTLDSLFISKYFFKYKKREFDKETIKNIAMNSHNQAIIEYIDGGYEIVENPLNIEDLKTIC